MTLLLFVRWTPHPSNRFLFPLRDSSSLSTITGPTPAIWIWTLVKMTSGSLLVGWTLLLFGYGQISMTLMTAIMQVPSTIHPRRVRRAFNTFNLLFVATPR